MEWLKALIEKHTKDGVLNTEELMKEVNTEFPKYAVPKEDFNKVNETKKTLESQITERDKQLKDLGAKVKDNDDLSKQIADLQETNKKTKAEYDTKIKDMNIDSAIKAKLSDTKYPDLLVGKFDRSKLLVADDGTVTGIDEQLTGIKETYKELFTPIVSGKDPKNKNINTPDSTKNPWSKEHFNLTLQAKMLSEDPELAAQYMAAQ
nr:MAG TPA: minor structural protein [Caudoviricetes sp.]